MHKYSVTLRQTERTVIIEADHYSLGGDFGYAYFYKTTPATTHTKAKDTLVATVTKPLYIQLLPPDDEDKTVKAPGGIGPIPWTPWTSPSTFPPGTFSIDQAREREGVKEPVDVLGELDAATDTIRRYAGKILLRHKGSDGRTYQLITKTGGNAELTYCMDFTGGKSPDIPS